MNNKKIAFLINSLDGGGAERVMTTLVNEFVKEYDCYLILIEKKIEYKIDDRINLIILDDEKAKSSFSKLFMIPVLSYKLSKIIKEYQFEQILSFLHRSNYINILSSILSKHKVIISERATPSAMYNDKTILSLVNKFLTTHLYNNADIIIPASKVIKNDLINNFNLKKEQKVIYNPCNVESIQEQANEPINIVLDRERTIITVGSLEKIKNQEILIKSFSKLEKDYNLIIIGKGKLESLLKNLVTELQLENRVTFIGFDVNPYKYMSKSSIFVLTSNSEGFPNVLVEAMICGCNVISTDCSSGPREILAPNSEITKFLDNELEYAEYGILIPINDEEKLYQALKIMTTDIELQTKYKKIAIKRIQELQIDVIIPQYKEQLENSMKENKLKNIIAFSKYSYDGPSSRYRFYN
ncbi:MAG: glycosyltransferase [Aliarcobacter sp.]|nr:glycosyltransferase [Aliarcobacter sp.]